MNQNEATGLSGEEEALFMGTGTTNNTTDHSMCLEVGFGVISSVLPRPVSGERTALKISV